MKEIPRENADALSRNPRFSLLPGVYSFLTRSGAPFIPVWRESGAWCGCETADGSSRHRFTKPTTAMSDIIYISAMAAFFIVSALYTVFCAKL